MLALFPVCLQDPIEDSRRGVYRRGVDADFSEEGRARMVERHGCVWVFGSDHYAGAWGSAPNMRHAFRSLRTFLAETLVRAPRWDRVPPALDSAVAFAEGLREGPDGTAWAAVADDLNRAVALVGFMSECSEERICAGWEDGNGRLLWRQLHTTGDEDGWGAIFTDASRTELRRLSADGYWWEWFEGDGLRPIPLRDWSAGRFCMECGNASDLDLPGPNGERYGACRNHLRELGGWVVGGELAVARAAPALWFGACGPRVAYDTFWPALRALVSSMPDFAAAGLSEVAATRVAHEGPNAVVVTFTWSDPTASNPLDAKETSTYWLPFVTDEAGPLAPAAAWELLATRGVIPFEWAGATTRSFVCATCGGDGLMVGTEGWYLEPCTACERRGLNAEGGSWVVWPGTLPHPPTLAAALALASNVPGMVRAEALVRDFYRRVVALEPRHEGMVAPTRIREGVVPVVWRVGPHAEQAHDVARRWNLTPDERAAYRDARLPANLALPSGSPLLAPCPASPEPADGTVPTPLRALYDRMCGWDARLGLNPWTPLYTLWAEGFRVERVSRHGLHLALAEFPVVKGGSGA